MNKGKKIISKNPLFTGKIKYLLQLFPNAKFIHIYRNPYMVFSSLRTAGRQIEKGTLPLKSANLPKKLRHEFIFRAYSDMMKTLFLQEKLIPPQNYIQLKYEDLEMNPLAELEKIYKGIDLNGFPELKSKYQQYIDSKKAYEKNIHTTLSTDLIDEIYHHWSFAIDKWGYEPPI